MSHSRRSPAEIVFSNLAQSNDPVLVVFGLDRDVRSLAYQSRPVHSQEHQLKSICHLVDTVFDSHTRHAPFLVRVQSALEGCTGD